MRYVSHVFLQFTVLLTYQERVWWRPWCWRERQACAEFVREGGGTIAVDPFFEAATGRLLSRGQHNRAVRLIQANQAARQAQDRLSQRQEGRQILAKALKKKA